VCLSEPSTKPELGHVINVWMSPGDLVKVSRPRSVPSVIGATTADMSERTYPVGVDTDLLPFPLSSLPRLL